MIRLPILIAATIACAPIAIAQTEATGPFAMSPTSLKPIEAFPRTPDGKPDFQNVVWATNYFPVFDATPMSSSLIVPEDEARRCRLPRGHLNSVLKQL